MRVYTESVAFKADQKLVDFVERKLSKMDQSGPMWKLKLIQLLMPMWS